MTVFIYPLFHQSHYWEFGFQVEFGRVGTFHIRFVTCVFNQSDLHAQANAQVRHFVGTGIFYGFDFAFDTAHTKTTRYQNSIHGQQGISAFFFNLLTVEISDVHIGFSVDACVFQGFRQRLVRLGQINVFADHTDFHGVFRIVDGVNNFFPLGQIGFSHIQLQLFTNDFVYALVVQQFWNFVNAVFIRATDDGALFHITEQGNLAFLFFRQHVF